MPAYYTADLGLTMGAVSGVLLLSRLFDAVTDPLIGWLSDRTRSRFGRRRLWMAASVPIFMLAVYKLFLPSGPVTATYLLTWLVVLWLGWTLLYIPYYALGAEISPDYDERPGSRAGGRLSAAAPTYPPSWWWCSWDFCSPGWEPSTTTCSCSAS